jgi:hypothetical protein
MKSNIKIALFTLCIASNAFAASNLECVAIYRTVDPLTSHATERRAALPIIATYPGVYSHAVELEGKYFSVNEEDTGDLLAQITTAPDYQIGSVNRARADSRGRYSLTEVNGLTIHRLECNLKITARTIRPGLGNSGR